MTDSELFQVFSDLVWVSMFFSCADVKRQSSFKGMEIMCSVVLKGKTEWLQLHHKLFKWNYAPICKLNRHIYSTVSTHTHTQVHAFLTQLINDVSVFALDWNFYNTTRWIFLGTSFKCWRGGICRREQQTSSGLSTWEEEEHLECRQPHRALCCLR